jgi:hypothetical protein
MARTISRAAAQAVKSFKYPIGTPVIVAMDDGREIKTTTRSVPGVVGGCAVIWLEGIGGCYLLSRVSAAQP